jgi:hypothetical protein
MTTRTSMLSRLSGLHKVSVIPYEETVYELGLSNMQYCSNEYLQEYISSIPQHPNVLNPHICILHSQRSSTAYYTVSKQGMTLHDFVKSKKVKKSHMTDIILQIINGYIFLIKNRILLTECSISPKFIWVQYDTSGKLCVYVVNTLEQLSKDNFGTVNYDKKYWSPELTSRYRSYIGLDIDNKSEVNIYKLKRTNTCVSNISCVYSIGLIIYFITSTQEPLETNMCRPILTSIIDPVYSDCIIHSTEDKVEHRPTLEDLKEMILHISIDQYSGANCCTTM